MTPTDAKGKAAPSAPLRILVAEDEAIIRLDLVEMLTDAGYQVVAEATNGLEAITYAREFLPDIAILDVKMPELDGISAAEQIIEISPVLMLTAFSQRELVERARDAGAMAYVVKPFSISDLVPAIEIAVSRHREQKALQNEVSDLQERLETLKSALAEVMKSVPSGENAQLDGCVTGIGTTDIKSPEALYLRTSEFPQMATQIQPSISIERPSGIKPSM